MPLYAALREVVIFCLMFSPLFCPAPPLPLKPPRTWREASGLSLDGKRPASKPRPALNARVFLSATAVDTLDLVSISSLPSPGSVSRKRRLLNLVRVDSPMVSRLRPEPTCSSPLLAQPLCEAETRERRWSSSVSPSRASFSSGTRVCSCDVPAFFWKALVRDCWAVVRKPSDAVTWRIACRCGSTSTLGMAAGGGLSLPFGSRATSTVRWPSGFTCLMCCMCGDGAIVDRCVVGCLGSSTPTMTWYVTGWA